MRVLRNPFLQAMMIGLLCRRGTMAWVSPAAGRRAADAAAIGGVITRNRQFMSSWSDDDDDDGWGGSPQRSSRTSSPSSSPQRRSSWGDDNNQGARRGGKSSSYRGRDSNNNDTNWGGGRREGDRRGRGSSNNNNNFDNRNRDRRRGGGDSGRRNDNDNGRNDSWNNDRNSNNRRGGKPEDVGPRIDMKGLEAEGFVHLYGLAPILSALKANRRDFKPRDQEVDMSRFSGGDNDYGAEDGDDESNAFAEPSSKDTKPEAQFTPWLFLQDRSSGGGSGRSEDKAVAADKVKQRAEELGVPVAYTDKGSLNALSGSRPHQGFVLRCGALEFESLSRIPLPDPSSDSPSSIPNLWLVLDEVVDPQNLGAILRSSYFLGGNDNNRLGVLVCSKNSAPPSPVVSAASAGALELLNVYSTNSLPRTLTTAREDGFRIIGAASSKPRGVDEEEVQLYDLQDLPKDDRPTLLVLGSEGHGLRTMVARLCTDFVRIPHGGVGVADDNDSDSDVVVDSLNVSVTGGILLWHLLHGANKV